MLRSAGHGIDSAGQDAYRIPVRAVRSRFSQPGRRSILLLAALRLASAEPVPTGPVPSREMFPLFLIAMAYQPVNPAILGSGRWQVELEHVQANTFEFSDVFKTQTPRDAQGRLLVTRDYVLAHAGEYAHLPLVYFFDVESARSVLRVRRGVDARTDLWFELPFLSMGGGHLDGPIESFHRIGFEQFGRDRVQQDRITLVVMEKGALRFYSDRPVRGKTQDPVLGLVRRLHQDDRWLLSLALSVKPPLTRAYGTYQTGWDHSFALTGSWRPATGHVVHFGAGYLRRPRGNSAFQDFPEGNFRDGIGAHLGWEPLNRRRVRPFFQLYAQSGYLHPQPAQKLDRPSLQHDLGLHWVAGRGTLVTLRYLNNITHNENTADMALGLSIARRF